MQTALLPMPIGLDGYAPVMMAHIDGDEWCALRPFCEALGVDYSNQLKKLRAKSWARVVLNTTHDSTGRLQDMVLIDRRTTLMWLAALSETRVSDEVRQRVIAYQQWAAQALDDTYTATQISSETVPSSDRRFDLLRAMVDSLEETDRKATQALTGADKAMEAVRSTAIGLSTRLNRTDARIDKLENVFQPPKTLALQQALVIEANLIVSHAPSMLLEAKKSDLRLVMHCCYALYDQAVELVKIGYASDLLRRWAEHESGRKLQLEMVWKMPTKQAGEQLERELKDKFHPFLRLGREWFAAHGVLPVLRQLDDPRNLRWPTLDFET